MSQGSRSITVMTLNLRFGLADDGKNSWNARKTAYPELFRQYRPDFMGVQESNDFQTAYLSEILYDHRYIGVHDDSPEFWQDNIIFYDKSWSCRQSRHYFLSETPDVQSKFADSKWPRQCTIGLFQNGTHVLIHVNTHFDFTASVQEKSAALILGFLDEFPKNTPTIITGDFNAPPSSETHGIFRGEGFKDPFDQEHTSTYHGFSGKDLGGHIDWILYRGPLYSKTHRVVRESFLGRYPSDHYPVLTVFEFQDAI